jgi:hypothetical protein
MVFLQSNVVGQESLYEKKSLNVTNAAMKKIFFWVSVQGGNDNPYN